MNIIYHRRFLSSIIEYKNQVAMTAATSSLAKRITLPNGLSIPNIHLGVYMMTGQEAYKATKYALEAGYRGIDGAQWYANEKEVGKAILDFIDDSARNTAGLKREDVFFTTKLRTNSTYDTVRASIKRSIRTCGLGYIDMFLLHSPYGGKDARLESWKAVEDAIEEGEVKIGGVSNFGIKHLEELISAGGSPSVNQIEVHPFNTRTDITSFCEKNGILVEAYAPLARAMRMKHPTIVKLAKDYNRTPAQMMVRWSLQHGYIPLPKSVTKQRIQENGKVDFEISQEDMAKMDGLDEYLVTDWDPTDAD